MPRSDSVGPEVIAFGGVVVDHVEDHLEAGGVQRPHHHLELADRVDAATATRRSAASGAK